VKRYFLGADIGSTKSHACIADETGTVVGFGSAGAGNHETVGYDGMLRTISRVTQSALASANLTVKDLAGAGFGISGFDWESERKQMLETIAASGLRVPLDIVNDATLGLIAGSSEGWGIAIVSGTGCNCRGRSQDGREGMVTGAGTQMGEGAGASELVEWTRHALAQMWTQRGPSTALAEVMVERAGARDLEDLIEGLVNERYALDASAAPLVLQTAGQGDAVAQSLMRRAGCELGELAKAVIRQLGFEELEFDAVLVGSMFNAGEPLIAPLRETVLQFAPGAQFVRLDVPPVIGGVLLGMEQVGVKPTAEMRARLREFSGVMARTAGARTSS
jgi:N-acetylglucosamine kinase-like BadF-type ATPase